MSEFDECQYIAFGFLVLSLFSVLRELSDMMSAKIFRFFDPLPPCPHLDGIYTINSRTLTYHVRFSIAPLPPSDADIISGSSLTQTEPKILTAAENLTLAARIGSGCRGRTPSRPPGPPQTPKSPPPPRHRSRRHRRTCKRRQRKLLSEEKRS